MNEPSSAKLEEQGESFSSEISFTWINPEPIEAGELMVPAKLSSPEAQLFAALHLVLRDLVFAADCLKQANELGIPNDRHLESKALIFSGVIGYARCFKTGVRPMLLDLADVARKGILVDLEIHKYLLSLRDKHIAHSVNDFEDCQAIAIVVGRPETGWRDGSAIGIAIKQTIGISSELLHRAIKHIESLKEFVEVQIGTRRLLVYSEFQKAFAKDGKWEATPMVKMSDRSRVARRRI
jgi:hypothetical protein